MAAQSGMSKGLRLTHPLCGSNLATLLRLLLTNGPITPAHLPQVAFALAVVLLRWPFSTVERMLVEWTRHQRSAMPAPVFIIGYWRSGTTHLHNLLSRSTQFGYIPPVASGLPWDLLGLVRALRPLLDRALPPDRYVDNVPVHPDSPQEDSIALANMLPLSYYHGLYFPRRFERHFRRGVFLEDCRPQEIAQWRRRLVHFLEKVSMHAGGKPLLIKNPVYTGHIRRLRDIWPHAKFIHLYRNPYVVFPSTRHFFTRLFPELALQDYDGVDVDRLILESYPRLMHALLTDAADLPQASFVDVRFEDLERDPLAEVERVYRTLDLPTFKLAVPRFEAYLETLQGYRKNTYAPSPETVRLVESHWQPYVDRWGYHPPAPAARRLN